MDEDCEYIETIEWGFCIAFGVDFFDPLKKKKFFLYWYIPVIVTCF